jgi:hypothetical protein
LEKQQEMSECAGVAPSPVSPALRRDFLASFDDAHSDKTDSFSTHRSTVLPGDDGTASTVTLPSSLLTGKLIQTPQGLALLLASRPQSGGYTELRAAYSSSATNTSNESENTVDTRNKRWTRAEDEQLKFALSQEDGPPINWKEIARLYFTGTRNCSQVCLTFHPIDGSFVSFGRKHFSLNMFLLSLHL